MQDTSAEAVRTTQDESAGAVDRDVQAGVAAQPVAHVLGLDDLQAALAEADADSSDSSRSPPRPLASSKTVVTSAASADTATLPEAMSIRMSMGSDPGNSQLVMSVRPLRSEGSAA